ncbi:cardiomyopathy-associated protein 5 [Pimephales promelas]|uniref:cardiomyopathy-associated protein 5 n=1 Tax=Pimephales promelas TaxID=90988 RepID=UPI0019556C8F|nr:cardiomyopathy-associated protein 5 [Pimephales promelas]KAG1937097.1 cardiomyopathy-associated protein [Pimephales promelas]
MHRASLTKADAEKRETMEIVDPENEMTALAEPEPEPEPWNTAEEDLRNSLREVVQDGAVKPKLHCLMMDPCFSMVTVQSEDSGISWETASSRCSTPWASEFNASEPSYSLDASGTAGRIVFIMDKELMSRRKKKQKSDKTRTRQQVTREILAEAERPAMVEVSVPNSGAEEQRTADLKEDRLFSLVSEGSEILNIIAPHKVSTVDEEESKGLEDNLFYLEETPAMKSPEIPDEPDLDVPPETEKINAVIPEPLVSFPHVQEPRRGATAEDYFEKFALLYDQAPSGAAPVEESPEQIEEKIEDAPRPEVEPDPGVSLAASMLDISDEHLDDVFYGGGGEPHDGAASAGEKGREFSQSSLKESGSALFGSEESVLTPIYLPEGPQKIIDLNLLEEPKALPFLYSDLYADAIGTRKKLDDEVESVTSEKSFHSQESDWEDRGYLEKFVLKVETHAAENDFRRAEERHDPFKLTGFVECHRAEVENPGDDPAEEITDFFRNSASSSPCEPVERLEREEETEVMRTPRVTFKEQASTPSCIEPQNQLFADDDDFSEEFLPVELSEDCPAWEESLPTIVRDAVKSTSTRTDESRLKQNPVSDNSQIQVQTTVKPIIPHYKPFLDLTPLMPVESEDEKETTEGETEKENTSSENSGSSSDPSQRRDHPHEDNAEAPASLRKSD